MKKETVQVIREIAEKMGYTVIHFQGDNSNFFADGIRGNSIIFDDANERCYTLRVNNDSASVRGNYKLTIFDYDQLQYGVLELYQDDISKVIDVISQITTVDNKEEIEKSFAKSKRDKRGKKVDYNPEVEVKKDDMGKIGSNY